MSEHTIKIEGINAVDFFGVNDANLQFMRNAFPKIKIIARGDELKVIGDNKEIEDFENKFSYIRIHYEHFGKLTIAAIADILEMGAGQPGQNLLASDDVLVHGRGGLIVKAKTENQRKLVESMKNNDLVFAIGQAGTGKTYTAVAIAVKALKEKEVKRIILARPAVEAGESLGFLPGDLRDKLDPYLQPLYDALRDMLPHQKLLTYLDDGTIEIAPLAYMRGRTLDHAIAILDEAQNTTPSQLKMFLTRMGTSAKLLVTGDVTQIDLPKNQKSGLVHTVDILQGIKGIDFVFLNEKDIIRHKLVGKILKAYDKRKEEL